MDVERLSVFPRAVVMVLTRGAGVGHDARHQMDI